jgi:transcriptional regulator with XRE-family HTH domain
MVQKKTDILEPDHSNSISQEIGSRLRLRRLQNGLSQAQLGAAVGVSFQQIQKYENGTNRISMNRLLQMASILEVPLNWFIEGLPAETFPHIHPGQSKPQANAVSLVDPNILQKRETLDLVRAYYELSIAQRHRLYQLLRAMKTK